ncbi:MAG: hypothetical protein ACI4KI_07520 [Candidatus Fimenecus sp.]
MSNISLNIQRIKRDKATNIQDLFHELNIEISASIDEDYNLYLLGLNADRLCTLHIQIEQEQLDRLYNVLINMEEDAYSEGATKQQQQIYEKYACLQTLIENYYQGLFSLDNTGDGPLFDE